MTELRRALQGDEPLIGLWTVTADPLIAEILARSGVPFVCVDQQHGAADLGAIASSFLAIEAAGSAPLSRVMTNDAGLIMRTLDAGAAGVIVPMVESGMQAAAAVHACRYPPQGRRSYGPLRARYAFGSAEPDVLEQALCIVMIETAAGFDNAEEILSTSGIDAVYLGPADLALSMGEHPADWFDNPRVMAVIDELAERSARAGVPIGMHCAHGSMAAYFATRGFRLLVIGSDASLLRQATDEQLHAARHGGLNPEASSPISPY